MSRNRFNTSRVCSSDNYALSKRVHTNELAKNHSRLQEMLVKEEIVLKKQHTLKSLVDLFHLIVQKFLFMRAKQQ